MSARVASALGGALALSLVGCVYYNAMWSAERFAKQARRAEARGLQGEARGHWMRAAAKAESVHVRHPDSRWADDAWVLHAEGLVRAGLCAQARTTIAQALSAAAEQELSERMALVAGECALTLGAPAVASRYLEPALASSDRTRRSRATWLAGRAAEARGDLEGAVAWYGRSAEAAAGPARARVVLAIGPAERGLATLDTVLAARFDEVSWRALLDTTAAVAGAGAASAALDRALARRRVPADARARLLLADGDRRFAARDLAVAEQRYAAARGAAGDRPEGVTARAGLLRVRAARLTTPAELEALSEELARLIGGGARPGPEVGALGRLVNRIVQADTELVAAFRAAELARDSLRAPALASALFLDIAARYPESLFAPKAMVAALPLVPEQRDSLLAALARRYPGSPYLAAAHGEVSPAYAALEDSLARALGLAAPVAVVVRGAGGVAAPVPGPRGPWWDVVFPPPPLVAGGLAAPAVEDPATRQGDERRPRGQRPDTARVRPRL